MKKLCIIAIGLLPMLASYGQGTTGFHEDFTNTTLAPLWIVPSGCSPSTYSLTANPDWLRYYVNNSSCSIVRPFQGTNWLLRTKVAYNFTDIHSGRQCYFDIVLKTNLTSGCQNGKFTFIQVQRDSDQNAPRPSTLSVSVVENCASLRNYTSPAIPGGTIDTWYIEVTRLGRQIAVNLSRDGTNWSAAFPPVVLATDPGDSQAVAIERNVFSSSSSYADFDYIYVDPINQPPVALCHDVIVSTDPGLCSAQVTPEQVDNGSYDPNGDTLIFSLSPAGPYPLGSTPVTLTVTDPQGASDSCNATITVLDTTTPVLSGCPSNAIYQCRSDVPAPPAVTAYDICQGSVPVSFSETETLPGSSCSNVITRTWVATDGSSNSASCQQLILVNDTTPPVITCGTNRTVECGIPWDFDAPTAIDLCSGTNVTITVVSTVNNAGCGNTFASTRTWAATDACGNTATCSQAVTVADTTPPALSGCPTNAVYQCRGDVLPPPTVTAYDACQGSVPVSFTETETRPGSSSSNVITRTWVATDGCSNSASCQQLILVNDTIPPVIYCPSNITIEFATNTGAAVIYSTTATDNCDPLPVVVCMPPSGSTFPIGATTVNCTATDAATNQSSCAFTVTVLGSRGTKQNVLAELIAYRVAVTNKDDGHKLDEAVEKLTESLDPSLWVDQTHLDRKHGDQVFNKEKETIHKLCELIKDHHGPIAVATLQDFINRMVRADRLLASIAIDDAVAAGVAPKKVAEARKSLAKGDAEWGEDGCEHGIDDYKNAWEHALWPKVSPPMVMVNGHQQLELLGEPGESLTVQVSSDMVNWVTLGTRTINGDGVATIEDTGAGRYPARFYRLVTP